MNFVEESTGVPVNFTLPHSTLTNIVEGQKYFFLFAKLPRRRIVIAMFGESSLGAPWGSFKTVWSVKVYKARQQRAGFDADPEVNQYSPMEEGGRVAGPELDSMLREYFGGENRCHNCKAENESGATRCKVCSARLFSVDL